MNQSTNYSHHQNKHSQSTHIQRSTLYHTSFVHVPVIGLQHQSVVSNHFRTRTHYMSGNNTSTGAGMGMTTQGRPGQGGQGGQGIGGFGTTTAGPQISTTAVNSAQSVHATGLFATNAQPAQATGQAVPGIVPSRSVKLLKLPSFRIKSSR